MRPVIPHQFPLCQHMALHSVPQRRFACAAQIGQRHVQRVQLMKIAVASDRRRRTAVARAVPIARQRDGNAGPSTPFIPA